MSTPRTLRASAFRDSDGWWTIKIPDLTSPGPSGNTITATGTATTFRGIDKAAHNLAAAWLDDDAVTVTVDVVIPDEVAKLWKDSSAAEEAARDQQERAAALRRDAVRALRSKGYPAEAAAVALGVSRQRITQLEKAPASDPHEKIAS